MGFSKNLVLYMNLRMPSVMLKYVFFAIHWVFVIVIHQRLLTVTIRRRSHPWPWRSVRITSRWLNFSSRRVLMSIVWIKIRGQYKTLSHFWYKSDILNVNICALHWFYLQVPVNDSCWKWTYWYVAAAVAVWSRYRTKRYQRMVSWWLRSDEWTSSVSCAFFLYMLCS